MSRITFDTFAPHADPDGLLTVEDVVAEARARGFRVQLDGEDLDLDGVDLAAEEVDGLDLDARDLEVLTFDAEGLSLSACPDHVDRILGDDVGDSLRFGWSDCDDDTCGRFAPSDLDRFRGSGSTASRYSGEDLDLAERAAALLGTEHDDAGSPAGDVREALRLLELAHEREATFAARLRDPVAPPTAIDRVVRKWHGRSLDDADRDLLDTALGSMLSTSSTGKRPELALLDELGGSIAEHHRLLDAFGRMDAIAFGMLRKLVAEDTVGRIAANVAQLRAAERFPLELTPSATVEDLARLLAMSASSGTFVSVEGDTVEDVEANGREVVVRTSSGWSLRFEVVPRGGVNLRRRSAERSTVGGVVTSDLFAEVDRLRAEADRAFVRDVAAMLRDEDAPVDEDAEADRLGEELDRKVDELADAYRASGESMAGYDFPADDQAFDAAREVAATTPGRSRD